MDPHVNTRANFKDLFESFKKDKAKVKVTLSLVVSQGPGITSSASPMQVSGEVLGCAQDYVSLRSDAGRVSYVSFAAIAYVEDAD